MPPPKKESRSCRLPVWGTGAGAAASVRLSNRPEMVGTKGGEAWELGAEVGAGVLRGACCWNTYAALADDARLCLFSMGGGLTGARPSLNESA